jgi:ferric-dicitrate binding protein FerR (iron transport regulator)
MAPPGATLYSGDVVRTESSPATVSFPRGDLLVLDRQSLVAFQGSSGRCLIRLEKGRLSFAAYTAQPICVETDGLALRWVGSFPSLAEVDRRADGSVAVAVLRGTISVTNLRPEAILVDAGRLIEIGPRLAQSQGPAVGTAAHGKMSIGDKLRTFRIGGLSHAASVAVLSLALGVVVAGVTVALTVSPSAP